MTITDLQIAYKFEAGKYPPGHHHGPGLYSDHKEYEKWLESKLLCLVNLIKADTDFSHHDYSEIQNLLKENNG
jgi:hypothetical protein